MTGKRAIVVGNSPRVSGQNLGFDTQRASSPISLEDDDDVDGYINEIPGIRSYGIKRPIGIETAPAKLRAFPQQQPLVKRRRNDGGTTSIVKRLFQEADPSSIQLVRKDVQELGVDPVHRNITQWNLKKKGKLDSELLELEQNIVHDARDRSDLEQVVTALLEQVSVLKIQLQEMAALKIQFTAQSKSLEDLKVEKGQIEKEKLQTEFRHQKHIEAIKASLTELEVLTSAEHTKMVKENANLTAANSERLEEVKMARAECSKMAEEIVRLTADNFEEVKMARAECSEMAEEIVRLTADNFEKLDEVKAARAALAQNSKRIESLMGSVSTLNIEVEDLNSSVMKERETTNASVMRERETMLSMWAAHMEKTKLEFVESSKKDFERLGEEWSSRFDQVSQERERDTQELEFLREELNAYQLRTQELDALRRSHRAVRRDREKDATELNCLRRKLRTEREDWKLLLKEMKEDSRRFRKTSANWEARLRIAEEKLLDYS